MIKFKCWKKIGTTETAEWKKNKSLSLVVGSAGSSGYEVELKKYSYKVGVHREVLKGGSSKSQALKFANKYMKSHDKC